MSRAKCGWLALLIASLVMGFFCAAGFVAGAMGSSRDMFDRNPRVVEQAYARRKAEMRRLLLGGVGYLGLVVLSAVGLLKREAPRSSYY